MWNPVPTVIALTIVMLVHNVDQHALVVVIQGMIEGNQFKIEFISKFRKQAHEKTTYSLQNLLNQESAQFLGREAIN